MPVQLGTDDQTKQENLEKQLAYSEAIVDFASAEAYEGTGKHKKNDSSKNEADGQLPESSTTFGVTWGKEATKVQVKSGFRGDCRVPARMFPKGFVARGRNVDLLSHVFPGDLWSDDSAFIGTSPSKDVARRFGVTTAIATGKDETFVYEMDLPENTVNVPKELKKALKKGLIREDAYLDMLAENERAVPFKINRKAVKGAWHIKDIKLINAKRTWVEGKTFIPSPYYEIPLFIRVSTIIKRVGYALTVVGVTIDGFNLFFAYQYSKKTGNYEPLSEEAARVAGGWSGAIALGSAFGKAGTICFAPIAPPWGSLAGGVLCGIVGSVAGYKRGGEFAKQVRKQIASDDATNDRHKTPADFNPFASLLPSILINQLHGETANPKTLYEPATRTSQHESAQDSAVYYPKLNPEPVPTTVQRVYAATKPSVTFFEAQAASFKKASQFLPEIQAKPTATSSAVEQHAELLSASFEALKPVGGKRPPTPPNLTDSDEHDLHKDTKSLRKIWSKWRGPKVEKTNKHNERLHDVQTNYDENLKNYPKAGEVEQVVCTVAQTAMKVGVQAHFAAVGAALTPVLVCIIPGGAQYEALAFAAGGIIGADASASFAKTVAKEINAMAHTVCEAVQNQLTAQPTPQPSAQSTEAQLQEKQTLHPHNAYERAVVSHMTSTTDQFEGHREHFAKMGLREKSYRSQSADRRTSVHAPTGERREGKRTSTGEWLWSRLPFATASADDGASESLMSQVMSVKTDDPSVYYPKINPASAIKSPAESEPRPLGSGAVNKLRTALPLPNGRGSDSAATDMTTAQLNTAQIKALSDSLKDLTTTLKSTGKFDYETPQGRATYEQFAINLGTAGSAFTDAATIIQRCGGGVSAKKLFVIGSHVSQIASGITSMLAAKAAMATATSMVSASMAAFSFVTGGLSVVFGAFSLMCTLFGDDESDRLAEALVDIHTDLHELRLEVRDDIRNMGLVLQSSVRALGEMVTQVAVNDGVILQSMHQLNEGVFDLKTQLKEHMQRSNAELKSIAHADLREARFHVQQYIAGTAIQSSDKAIRKSLDTLEFWLSSEFKTPVINEANVANVIPERAISIFQTLQQERKLIPGFFAARLRHHFGTLVDIKYTEQPPMEPFVETAQELVMGLQSVKASSDDCETAMKPILDTLQNSLDFISMLKTNTALWQALFESYTGYRNQVAQIIKESKMAMTPEFMKQMANSPYNTQFKSALYAMEEQRILIDTLSAYVDGCSNGDLTRCVLALDSMNSVCQNPKSILNACPSLTTEKALQIKDKLVTAPLTVSYEQALINLLARFKEQAIELIAVIKSPAETERRPLGSVNPLAPAPGSDVEGDLMTKDEIQLAKRTKAIYQDYEIDLSWLSFWKKPSEPSANSRIRIIETSHLTARQRVDLLNDLNRQDDYKATSIRVGDEKCIRVELPMSKR